MTVRHDYRCEACGFVLRDHPGGQPFTRPDLNPLCPRHLYPLGGTRMSWLPAARFSVFTDGAAYGPRSTAKFTTTVEDPGSPSGYRPATIGSLADIRRLEKESAQREANGEGQRLVWRDYSQDRSNTDVHTLGADPSVPVPKRFANGTPVTIRRGDQVAADHGEQHDAPRAGPDTLSGAGL